MDDIARAAEWLAQADGLLITAGAGMGIDSGLPDFRGPGGFWQIYPALGRAKIAFESVANPAAFADDPRLAWGFYGHRLLRYRETTPHAGFYRLAEFAGQLSHGAFVMTSNVDGQFQKAGYPEHRICEIHGSIRHLQCTANCRDRIWRADDFQPDIDSDNCRLLGELPTCPHCGALARPNILMFGDWAWNDRRTALQQRGLMDWLAEVNHPVCIEIGAGTRISTIRSFSERCGAKLIRINPQEPEITDPENSVGLPLSGLAGIEHLLDEVGRRALA